MEEERNLEEIGETVEIDEKGRITLKQATRMALGIEGRRAILYVKLRVVKVL